MPREFPRAVAWMVALCLLIMGAVVATHVVDSSGNVAPTVHGATEPANLAVQAAERADVALVPAAVPADPMYSFDGTIYEVHMGSDQIGRLDVEALTKAAGSSESFEKALSGLGGARPLYRVNHGISLGDEVYFKLSDGKPDANGEAPAGRRMGADPPGTTAATFDLIPKAGAAAGTIEMDLEVSASVLEATGGNATAGAPLIRHFQVQQNRTVVVGKPFLYVSADAGNLDAKGEAVGFVARVVLGAPGGAK